MHKYCEYCGLATKVLNPVDDGMSVFGVCDKCLLGTFTAMANTEKKTRICQYCGKEYELKGNKLDFCPCCAMDA